jgi:multidrug efflux pump
VSLYLPAATDLTTVRGRRSFQYTLQGSTFEELNEWTPKLVAALQTLPFLADVSSDQQNKAL